jgi:hypothetical protein
VCADGHTVTPLDAGKYLMLGGDAEANWKSVAQVGACAECTHRCVTNVRQFSVKDADALPKYEAFLDKVRQ